MKARSALLLAIFLSAAPLHAQRPAATPTDAPAPSGLPMWKASLPGGSYQVALRSMVSVSIHEYVVDGAARVTEVNIDTSGNALPRFYYLEPVTPQSPLGIGQSTMEKVQEIVEEAGERTGQSDVWQKVMKNYPGSTHSHTIEFRIDSKEGLQKLYNSAEKAFRTQRPGTFKLEGEKEEE